MLLKKLFCLVLLFSCLSISAQEFIKEKDKFYKQLRIEYLNRDAGIIIVKTIDDSSANSPKYFLGLTMMATLVDESAFMKDRPVIVFEDNSNIILNESIAITIVPPSKQQANVRHQITEQELELFKTKKIKSFRLFDYVKDLAKWDKEEVQKAFIKIVQINN